MQLRILLSLKLEASGWKMRPTSKLCRLQSQRSSSDWTYRGASIGNHSHTRCSLFTQSSFVCDVQAVKGTAQKALEPQRVVKRIRPNKFRKSLLTREQTAHLAPLVAEELQSLYKAHLCGASSAAQFCSQYVLLYLQAIRPSDWRGGWHGDPTLQSQWAPDHPLHIVSSHSLRSVPLSVNRSLYYWEQGQYNLQLFFDIPSPKRVLELQCRGQRCVSALVQPHQLNDWVLGERDPLSFLLHDLIHADRFFSRPEFMSGQIGFCRLMRETLRSRVYDPLLKQDSTFREDLDYVIADMNSHGVHMVKYLKAVLTQAVLRAEGQEDGRARLSAEGQRQLAALLAATVRAWPDADAAEQMMEAVNTEMETPALQLRLERFLQGAAQSLPVDAPLSMY